MALVYCCSLDGLIASIVLLICTLLWIKASAKLLNVNVNVNYFLNSAWHGGDQFVALLRWYGSPGFFDSGLQVICIVGSGVSHFPLDNTGLVSLLASQAHQHHGHLTNSWCFWQCGQVPNPAGK